jgi:hypothetical protein
MPEGRPSHPGTICLYQAAQRSTEKALTDDFYQATGIIVWIYRRRSACLDAIGGAAKFSGDVWADGLGWGDSFVARCGKESSRIL